MDSLEPIKVSTLGKFYWCAIESYIYHLRELDDERLKEDYGATKEMQQGEKHHTQSYGLLIHTMEEDTGVAILEKMKKGKVSAVNYKDYQIQGAPDSVLKDGNSVKVKEVKTTNWGSKWRYKTFQIPPARFQTQVYSWMLSCVPGIKVENPIIYIQKRKNSELEEWFEYEVEFNKSEVENDFDRIFSLFDNPKSLKKYKPSSEWKCKNDSHWKDYQKIVLNN